MHLCYETMFSVVKLFVDLRNHFPFSCFVANQVTRFHMSCHLSNIETIKSIGLKICQHRYQLHNVLLQEAETSCLRWYLVILYEYCLGMVKVWVMVGCNDSTFLLESGTMISEHDSVMNGVRLSRWFNFWWFQRLRCSLRKRISKGNMLKFILKNIETVLKIEVGNREKFPAQLFSMISNIC